ncbi:unnamed protein product [Rhizophagus irregularis]|nr:unnamed protein product [Rhizophagus irregularis]
MPWIKPQIWKNVSFNTLVIGKVLNISMAIDPINRSTWSVSGGKELLLEFFKQYLLTKGKYLMTWKQYCKLTLLPIQGKVARWYREVAHLCTSRIDNIIVTDNLELAEVNYWAFLLDIIPDMHCKQVIFVQEPLADSDAWLIGKVNKIRCHVELRTSQPNSGNLT